MESVFVRTVPSFDRLRSELAVRRECDWLSLVAEWDGGAMRFGTKTHTLTELAKQWSGQLKLRVFLPRPRPAAVIIVNPRRRSAAQPPARNIGQLDSVA